MNLAKGKYELFKVGDELVFSEDREKIKAYAEKRGFTSISYKMSSDNKESLKSIAEEIGHFS